MIDTGLTKEAYEQITALLNKILADEFLLYTKTLNFHWNVTGHPFDSMHAFFKHQYEDLFDIVDDVAERVRSLGSYSYGTMREFVNNSSLKENVAHFPGYLNMVSELLKDHEAVIRLLRLAIKECSLLGDEGTANFITDKMEKHEKMAWMLRATLQNDKA